MGRPAKHHIDVKELHRLYVIEQHSTVAIAKMYNIFFADGKPNAPFVQRLLESNNIPLRNKSTAQKLALDNGVIDHPTAGKPRSDKEKIAIGTSMVESYKHATKEQKAKRTKGVKDFWTKEENKEKQIATRKKIGDQLQKTIQEGTYLEQSIAKFLIQQGYSVQIHQGGGVFGHAGLEADMVVTGKGVSVCLEIDGKKHFDLFLDKGMDKLIETIRTDNKKNKIVLGIKGAWMVRILYDFGNEITYVQATLQKLYEILEYIQKMNKLGDELKATNRLIILDMGLVLGGKALRDNKNYEKAIKILTSK